MAHQLIEIILPEGRAEDIPELLHDVIIIGFWRDQLEDHRARIHLLVETGRVETVLDALETYLQPLPDARAILLPVEAVIPQPENGKPEGEEQDEEEVEQEKKAARISHQELYNDVATGVSLSTNYLVMVVLSAIIAAIGLVRNDMAIIIGAMVLAPLLLPNVAFALANTLGDTELGWNAVKTAIVGLSLAILIGTGIGLFVSIDPSIAAIDARTRLGWSDLLLALASGSAGVLALTGGGRFSLVGVMVAVALMPPLVTGGLMFGAGFYQKGFGALNLALANIICVNLAGVVTFHLQGISPTTWWEKNKARRASRRATGLLSLLFALLGGLLFFANQGILTVAR
ncbi:MAG TPA: TIGR00341 family protein [Desulfobulbus sp.]|nr:TIGR00341 family protein [Desulfobulbus sp.]